MNEFFKYAIDQLVWTIDHDRLIVLPCKVLSVRIEITESDTKINYILANNLTTYNTSEDEIYETYTDAVTVLEDIINA